MLELTQNNHFIYGRVDSAPDTFLVQCGALTREVETPFSEAVYCARYIHETQKEKIKLCLSGGIDSESMLQAFAAAKVPCEAVFLRFLNNLNQFDISTNIEKCEALGVSYSFVDLDVLHFFESGKFYEVAQHYACPSPQLAAHMWLLEQIDGIPILAGNPIAPIWKAEHWYFVGLPGELHTSYFNFFTINQRAGVPWFFLYSPELIASFLKLEVMQKYVNRQITREEEYTYSEKVKSYQQGGFRVQPRVNKFTGFELVRQHYDKKHGRQYGTAFDELFRRPLEKLFPFPEQYLQLVPQSYLAVSDNVSEGMSNKMKEK
ncbi:hypothetical protein [Pseudobdellovibrio exovorus]|uniref:Asparagine synthetase domain-containing protein n=1 Tax=Pseudobdellovibrio exovorus JSS TaxID=1184267 RepID=M4V568_9BACT|nr:hypothetical protein [Pseudobdellovibrio exovorus]AGH94333.1 hypothetical protein A11Q_113 [Pseudobdellovibrio exovorus JSS]